MTTIENLLNALRANAEGETDVDGFRDVYLDNAFADMPGTKPQALAAFLGQLEKMGFYKVVDGYAWGRVKAEG